MIFLQVTRISKADDNFMIPTKKSLESEPIERRLASSRIWDSLTGTPFCIPPPQYLLQWDIKPLFMQVLNEHTYQGYCRHIHMNKKDEMELNLKYVDLLMFVWVMSLLGFLDDVFNPENAEYLDDPWEITMINDTMLTTATVSYEEGSTKLEGFVAYDKTITGPRPIVIIIPDWDGLDAYEMWRAKLLAMMGYVGKTVESLH